jgi:YVTN family beta-propeller protein
MSTSSNQTVTTIPLAAMPGALANNPKTNQLYADYPGPNQSGSIAVIDEMSNQVTSTVTLPGAGGVAVNPIANRIYGTDGLNSLWVIDGSSNAVLTSVTVGKMPGSVATNPLNGRVYVANQGDGTITVVQDRAS